MENSGRQSGNCKCGRQKCGIKQGQCKWEKSTLIENIDYVECKICNACRGVNITNHVKIIHSMKKEEYIEKFGPCNATKLKESLTAQAEGSRKRWKSWKEDESLEGIEKRKEFGNAISKRIMSSDAERETRKNNMTILNKSDEQRKRSSDTAKMTSAREDVIKNRSQQLQLWRDNNPDDFYDKCIAKMHKIKSSLPEKLLYEKICEMFPEKFKNCQVIKRKGKFLDTKTSKRQIDIMNKENKIVIEFDGPCHFRSIHGKETLEKIKIRDKELNDVLVEENFVVIRISSDQFSYKTPRGFNENCLAKVTKIVNNNIPGLYLIGDDYKNA